MTPEERAKELFHHTCTCAPVDIGVGEQHEPTCGYPNPKDVALAIRAAEIEALEWAKTCVERESCECAGRVYVHAIRREIERRKKMTLEREA